MHVPPYQDLATLARNVCLGESTIERLVALGKFPPPVRMVGGKRIWRWATVEQFMEMGEAVTAAEGITDATRRLSQRRQDHY